MAAALLADGSSDVSVTDVADAAGVSNNLVYTYFGNRAGLLCALLDETADHFDALVRTRLAELGAEEDWLDVSTRVYFDAVEALGPAIVALFRTSHGEVVVEQRRRQRHDAHVDAVARLLCQVSGAPADRCTAHAAVLMAAINAAAELVVRGQVTRAEAEDLYLTMARPVVAHVRGAG